MSANSPRNDSWASIAMNLQKRSPSTPEQKIKTYLSDARSSAGAVKQALNALITKHVDSQLNDNMRKSEMDRLQSSMDLAIEKSKWALENVPGIKMDDAIEIEDDIRVMEKSFIKGKTDTFFIQVAKNCAESLERTWESHYKSLNMGKIKKNLGSYATGQMFNHSAKQGGRRKRNHKRTHRKRTHTHRNRK